jgi:thioredoxin
MQIRLLFLAIISFLLNACNGQNELSATDFNKAIADGKGQILDVRTPGEFNSGHIAKALSADWNNQSVYLERIKYLDKTKPVYIYCLSGGRSARAAQQLRENGFTVKELKGGINAWKLAGLPLEGKSTKTQMSVTDYNSFISTNSSKLVLVDFGAEWCAPCKKMEPYLNKLVQSNKDKLAFLKVEGGNDIDVMKSVNVESIPYLLLYKNGKEVWRHAGFIEEADLANAVGTYLH